MLFGFYLLSQHPKGPGFAHSHFSFDVFHAPILNTAKDILRIPFAAAFIFFFLFLFFFPSFLHLFIGSSIHPTRRTHPKHKIPCLIPLTK